MKSTFAIPCEGFEKYGLSSELGRRSSDALRAWLFKPQRFNRIQLGGPLRRIETEKDTNQC